MSDYIGYSDDGGRADLTESEGEEFDIDDSLPILEKIQKYIKSEVVLHRLYVLREISELLKQETYEVLDNVLLPIVEMVVVDQEPVIRQALVEQVPLVAECFIRDGGESGYTKLLDTLLPIVAQLTTDRNPQVRMSAIESLQEMAKLIKHKDLELHLIPFVRSLVNDSTEEEHRVQAANLCHNLSPILGTQLTQQIFLPFVSKLSCDPSFRVRKAIAGNLGNICQTIGVDATTEHILPIFIELSKDEIWSVRKGCAEVLVSVSQNVSPIERYSKLIQVFEQFVVEDPSRWVNSTAYQNLGPFIATFDGSQVTPKLLRYFTEMIIPASSRFPDSDLVTHCAFNFPAVLYTVGNTRWPELSETYFNLVNDTNWKVRRSLSHSLHEVAKILGPQETKTSLLQTFNLFLQDLDEVKVGVIRHFAEFLESVEPSLREAYITSHTLFISDPHKWRFRKLISKQLGRICDLFDLKTIHANITPIIFKLLTDPVSKVRNYAASGVGSLITKIQNYKPSTNTTDGANSQEQQKEEEELAKMSESILEKIKLFASDESYSSRQIFTRMCYYLVDQIDLDYFEVHFLPLLLKLADDPIPNVRLVTAEVLATKIATKEPFVNNVQIGDKIKFLQDDKDIDVVYFSKVLNNNNNNIVNSISTEETPTTTDDTSELKSNSVETSNVL